MTILTTGFVGQASVDGLSATSINTPYKFAAVYKTNDVAISANSGTVGTDTVAVIPINLTRLFIGSRLGTEGFLNGTIKRLTYYPLRCTNAQLQALTS